MTDRAAIAVLSSAIFLTALVLPEVAAGAIIGNTQPSQTPGDQNDLQERCERNDKNTQGLGDQFGQYEIAVNDCCLPPDDSRAVRAGLYIHKDQANSDRIPAFRADWENACGQDITGSTSSNRGGGASNISVTGGSTVGGLAMIGHHDFGSSGFTPSGGGGGGFSPPSFSPPGGGIPTETTVAVPGPVAGAGLPGLILATGGLLAWLRKTRKHLLRG